jgi:AcrR family transcriptional regulator
MTRPFRQQIDEGILDRAAALFARRGFAKTSVQDIADAVGLSKAGLLHHYSSKDALREAVLAQSAALTERALQQVAAMPPGPRRDRRAVEALVDLALARPGTVAFLLGTATAQGDAPPELDDPAAASAPVFQMFGVDADADPERLIRVIGATAALGVLALAAHRAGETAAWRSYVIDTSFDALGHPPAALSSRSDQVEA